MDNWKTNNKSTKYADKNLRNALIYFWNKEYYIIRQLILKAFLLISCGPILAVIAYVAIRIPDYESKGQLFAIYIIIITIYICLFKNYYESLIFTVEKYITIIRINVMDRIRKAELISFEEISSEKIYSALTFDIMSVSEVSHSIALGIISIFLIIDLMFYLAYLSWQACLLFLFAIFLASFYYINNQQQLRKAAFTTKYYEKKTFKSLNDLLYGFKELKLNVRKNNDFYKNGVKKDIAQLQELKLFTGHKITNNYSIVYGLNVFLIVCVVLFLPISGLVSTEKLVTIVAVVLFLPIVFLIDQVPRLTLASISLQRLFELENELSELSKESKRQIILDNTFAFHELKYTNISFNYNNDRENSFELGPLSISVKAGEILFITGGNGSGKSTLLKLITGLYPCSSGHVYLNKKEVDIGCYRSLFSVIFSDYHLFDRFYGSKGVNSQKVNELIKLMHLESKVKFENNRFSTLNLSTGQRKRLALTMSIVADKPVAVFDEWAADQDPAFRCKFYENILPQLKKQGKAIIVISHDEKFFCQSDQIVRLDFGQIRSTH